MCFSSDTLHDCLVLNAVPQFTVSVYVNYHVIQIVHGFIAIASIGLM